MRKYLTLFLILLSLASTQAQTLRITEFLASNFTGIVDEDGTPQGWVEIWNPSATGKVSMNGMKLTDGTNTWNFPFVEIMPDERMIVFMSAKNRVTATAPLHSNFKLSPTGGTIRLLNSANATLSEFVSYPAQQPDVSYGRDEWDIAVNPTQVGFYSVPTPEERNNYDGPGVAGKVVFATTSRAYTGSIQIAINLAVADPDTQIRYTLNGTVPTLSSTLYSGPINVTTTQQIRARAFKTGLLPGETESHGYLLLDGTTTNFSSAMPLIALTSFGATISDTLDTASFVWVWEPAAPDNRSRFSNTPVFASRIVVDKRGSSTLGNPKFNLNMEFRNGRDDDDRDNALLGMPSQSDWVLGAPYDFDRALVRNPVAYALSNATGQYASRTKQAEVFIDVSGAALNFTNAQSGDYFGVYNITEKVRRDNDRVDIVNLRKYDNDPVKRTGGYLWKVDRIDAGDTGFSAGGQLMAYYDPKEIEIKSPQRDPQEAYLTSYINSFNSVLQSGSWNNPVTGYAQYLDVPAAIDHHLAMVWPFNVDALRLSGYWTKQRGPQGAQSAKMKPAPVWDYDRTMDSTDNRDDNPNVWRSTVADFGTDFFNYTWWNRLFLDIEFYQKYIDRWLELRRGPLSQANTDAIIDAINAEISAEAVTRDLNRWARTKRSPYVSPLTGLNYTGQNAEIQRIKDFLQRRATFMDSQWVGPVNVSVAEGNVPVGTQVTLTGPAGATIYYTLDGADPRPTGGGLPGGTVLTYTGTPIEITQTTRLRARAYHPTWTALTGANNPPLVSRWSGLTNVRYSIDTRAAVGNLAVTEINFNPADPSAAELAINPVFEAKNFEYVELKNVGTQPIDLGGAEFTNGVRFKFTGQNAITVPPGGYFIVASNPAAFAARYGTALQVVGPWDGDLSNQGERLVIRNFAGSIILDFTYDDAWFPNGDGNGGSFEYIGTDYSKQAYENPANWRDSTQVLGSPGAEGLGPAPVVVINEILTHSTTPRVDAIEFYNPGTEPVDVSGWYISDASGEVNSDEYKKYRIPNGTVIPAGGYYVATEVNFNPNGAWNPTPGPRDPNKEFALDADHGDDVWLVEADGAGNLKRFVAHADFGAALTDVTWGRWPNGTGKLYPMQERTLFDEASATVPLPGLGAPNSTPRFGPLFISEVQHSPSVNSADLEFIEIHNPTAAEQSLAHWQLRGSVDFDFTNQTIPAFGTIVITAFDPSDTTKADAFKTFYNTPGVVLAGPWSNGDRLGGNGEVVLYRAGVPPETEPNFYPQTWEDETNYDDEGDWPAASGGTSLNRLRPVALGDLPASWVAQPPSPGNPVNSAPIAATDTIHTPLTGGDLILNVQANDSDAEADAFTITQVGTPTNGTAAINAGSINYAPGASYNGNDSFSYTIADTYGAATVGTIELVNALPVAVQDNVHVLIGTEVATLSVRANDTDADNDALTIVSVGTPINGSAITDGQTITYTPGPGFAGEDEFTYTIKDGFGGTAIGTVVIGNTPPVAAPDLANTSGDPVTIDVLANDTDAELDPLTVVQVSDGAFGTAVIQGTSVVYTPGSLFLGVDTFTYTVSDGIDTSVGTVQIRATTLVGLTLAATGSEVPGKPGNTYLSLQVPAIGNDGLLAWLANVRAPGVKSKSFLVAGNPASGIYGKGDLVPEMGGPVFSKFKTPVVDGAGRVAFIGTLSGSGVTAKNNTAIFAMQPGGSTSKIARIGEGAPEAGAAFAKFVAMDASDGETVYLATLSGKASGVWAWDGTNHRRVLGSGQTVETTAGSRAVSSISLLGAVPGSPGHPRSHRGGELAMSVGFADKSKGVALATLEGEAWSTSVLALSGQSTAFGGTWKTFGPAALAAPGTVALSATLAGATKASDTAIVLLRDGADPVLVAREGQGSPAGAAYKSFTNPVANSDGVISFTAKLAGATATSDDVLVSVDAANVASVVARESQLVPDLGGVTWKKFVSFALPSHPDSGPIILAQIAGPGVTKKNNLGLWAQATDGSLVLVARTGQSITVNGSSKTPSKLALLNALPPVQGSGRSFNEAQHVAFLATFTDGSQAIQVVRVP